MRLSCLESPHQPEDQLYYQKPYTEQLHVNIVPLSISSASSTNTTSTQRINEDYDNLNQALMHTFSNNE